MNASYNEERENIDESTSTVCRRVLFDLPTTTPFFSIPFWKLNYVHIPPPPPLPPTRPCPFVTPLQRNLSLRIPCWSLDHLLYTNDSSLVDRTVRNGKGSTTQKERQRDKTNVESFFYEDLFIYHSDALCTYYVGPLAIHTGWQPFHVYPRWTHVDPTPTSTWRPNLSRDYAHPTS